MCNVESKYSAWAVFGRLGTAINTDSCPVYLRRRLTEEVAVKQYTEGWVDGQSKRIMQEVVFLDSLRSPHVVELVDAYRDSSKTCYIVMERLTCLKERLPTHPWETRLAMRCQVWHSCIRGVLYIWMSGQSTWEWQS